MEKEIQKECKTHGMTRFLLQGKERPRYRCAKCSIRNVDQRRKLLKSKAVEYKGGKCELCGYNKCVQALHFHHLDPTKKDFGIASSQVIAWDKLQKEIDKCALLCGNCHVEVHNNLAIYPLPDK